MSNNTLFCNWSQCEKAIAKGRFCCYDHARRYFEMYRGEEPNLFDYITVDMICASAWWRSNRRPKVS